jgi:hypothetical protein
MLGKLETSNRTMTTTEKSGLSCAKSTPCVKLGEGQLPWNNDEQVYLESGRRVRGCDGSHNRAARQALAMRGFKQGKLAGNGQEKTMS